MRNKINQFHKHCLKIHLGQRTGMGWGGGDWERGGGGEEEINKAQSIPF